MAGWLERKTDQGQTLDGAKRQSVSLTVWQALSFT
jgi:hypothetical protein